MRRGLSSFLIGLSLLAASLAWSGYVMLNTVLNPDRAVEVANQLFDSDSVRSAITSRMADGFTEQLPDDVPVPSSAVTEAADQALATPGVEDSMAAAVAEAWRNALEGADGPVTVAGDALSAAGRDALVAQQGALDGVLPSAPNFEVKLPTAGFGWLATVRDVLRRFTRIAFIVAVAAGGAAFGVAPDRAAVPRRIAHWSFGAAAFWLLLGYGVPFVAGLVAPVSTALITGLIEIFVGAMINPALMLAFFGAAMLAFSHVLPSLMRTRGASVLGPSSRPIDPTELPTARPAPFDQPGLANRVVPPYDPRIHGNPQATQEQASQEQATESTGTSWVPGQGYVD